MASPAKACAICTPDCLTPTRVPRESGAAWLAMSRFVTGLDRAWIAPETMTARISQVTLRARAATTRESTAPPYRTDIVRTTLHRSTSAPKTVEHTAAERNAAVAKKPNWARVRPRSSMIVGLMAVRP